MDPSLLVTVFLMSILIATTRIAFEFEWYSRMQEMLPRVVLAYRWRLAGWKVGRASVPSARTY
jgi:hypothetical protein